MFRLLTRTAQVGSLNAPQRYDEYLNQSPYIASLAWQNTLLLRALTGKASKSLLKRYCCPIKVFQWKTSLLFHRTVEFPACLISDYSTEPIKCLL